MIARTVTIFLLALLVAACNTGFPREPGRYPIQPGSVTYDGQAYHVLWVDRDGTLRRASGDDVRMVRDDETYLEIGEGAPILHLRPDEPVALRDRSGAAAGWWLPFLVGTMVGRDPVVVGAPDDRRPTYRYPPADVRPGETVTGSQSSERPLPLERRPQPAPGTVSGQAGGTGGGAAATGKMAKPAAGQAGGSGAGAAATRKVAPAPGSAGLAPRSKPPVLGGKPSSGLGGARSVGGFRGRR